MMRGEAHHVLFPRRLWRVQAPARDLRENPWLQPYIDAPAHRLLHQEVGIVPVADHPMSTRALEAFEPVVGDYLRTIDNLMFSIEEAGTGCRSRAMDRRLGELMVANIELQLPYIIKGLIV